MPIMSRSLKALLENVRALKLNDWSERLPKVQCVDLWCDKNFYGHPGEGADAADEAAGHRNRLPDVARDRDWDQIEAAEAAIRRVESDPAGSGHVDLRPRVGWSRAARSERNLVRIV